MSNLPALVDPLTPPAELSVKTRSAIAFFRSHLETTGRRHGEFSIAASVSPSANDRAFLVRRESELAQKMAPAPQDVRVAQATKLLQSFAGAAMEIDDAKSVLASYIEATDGLPFWAIDRAVKNFIQGKVEGVNPSFAPPGSALALEARRIVQIFRDEHHTIKNILKADIYSDRDPAEVARINEGFKKLAQDVACAADPWRKKPSERTVHDRTQAEAEGYLETWAAMPPKLELLSEAMRAMLAQKDAAE